VGSGGYLHHQDVPGPIAVGATGAGEDGPYLRRWPPAVPPELWPDLRSRSYLSLAVPPELGGRGVPFSSFLELMELFAQSHASVRMIVHVCNGIWRAMASSATPEQTERFVKPAVAGQLRVAFALTERAAGSGADLGSTVTRGGRHLLPERREALDHLLADQAKGPPAERKVVMTHHEHPNVTLAREGLEAMQRGDTGWMEQHLADDVVWHVGGNSKWAGAGVAAQLLGRWEPGDVAQLGGDGVAQHPGDSGCGHQQRHIVLGVPSAPACGGNLNLS
jgi:Acyl-CoA dehydrogenase, N-terminal domain